VDGKLERLKEAGLITTSEELPREYQAVVEGLTDDELDVVVAVKRRLDEADASSKAGPFTNYMVF
jgi:hypothetical protein